MTDHRQMAEAVLSDHFSEWKAGTAGYEYFVDAMCDFAASIEESARSDERAQVVKMACGLIKQGMSDDVDPPFRGRPATLDDFAKALSQLPAKDSAQSSKFPVVRLIQRIRNQRDDICDHLRYVLPMAKGYALANPVGRNHEFIANAQTALAAIPTREQQVENILSVLSEDSAQAAGTKHPDCIAEGCLNKLHHGYECHGICERLEEC